MIRVCLALALSTGAGLAQAQTAAADFVSLFRRGNDVRFTVFETRLPVEGGLLTRYDVRGKTAIVYQETASGSAVLYFPETGQASTCGRPSAQEPIANTSYLAKIYANANAGRPRGGGSLLDQISGLFRGGDAGSLGDALLGALTGEKRSAAMTLGPMERVANPPNASLWGKTVDTFTQKLGRAVSTVVIPQTEGAMPLVETTRVDRDLFVETYQVRSRTLSDAEMAEMVWPESVVPAEVKPTELFERFALFILGNS